MATHGAQDAIALAAWRSGEGFTVWHIVRPGHDQKSPTSARAYCANPIGERDLSMRVLLHSEGPPEAIFGHLIAGLSGDAILEIVEADICRSCLRTYVLELAEALELAAGGLEQLSAVAKALLMWEARGRSTRLAT